MTKQEYKECIEAEVYKNLPKDSLMSLFRRFWQRRFDPSSRCCWLIRKMQYNYHSKSWLRRKYATFLYYKIWRESGCLIALTADIGKGLHIPHPNGIVIGGHVAIGEHCSIYQQVTLGGARTGDVKKGNQPMIGDNVTIFSGAKVLGKIRISDNCIIGAQALMLQDAPQNSVWVGIPAKQVKVGHEKSR